MNPALLLRRPTKPSAMTATNWKTGTLVKLYNPTNADEAWERFTVVEMRGDRVLVADADEYWDGQTLRPTFVYLASELTEA